MVARAGPGGGATRRCDKSASSKRQQKRCLLEPQARRDQQLGEERVARAVAVSAAGPLGTIDGQTAKSDITKHTIILKGHEADIGSLGGAFIGIVAGGNAGTPAAMIPAARHRDA